MSIHPIRPHLLVLGGTGFIGYHLILSAKKKGWKVTSVSLSQPKKYRYVDGVNYLKINITNLKEMKKKLIAPITYVVNLSGYVNHASFGEEGKKIINTHFLVRRLFADRRSNIFTGNISRIGMLH